MERKLAIFVVICVLSEYLLTINGYIVTYSFRRYPYKKKQRNERYIKRLKAKCENEQQCQGMGGVTKLECERTCMSQQCYLELYGNDKLEDGEIDVRYNSFKGCIIQTNPP